MKKGGTIFLFVFFFFGGGGGGGGVDTKQKTKKTRLSHLLLSSLLFPFRFLLSFCLSLSPFHIMTLLRYLAAVQNLYRGKQSRFVRPSVQGRYRYSSPSSRGVLGDFIHEAKSRNEHGCRSVVRLKVSNFRIFTTIPFTLKIEDYSI